MSKSGSQNIAKVWNPTMSTNCNENKIKINYKREACAHTVTHKQVHLSLYGS